MSATAVAAARPRMSTLRMTIIILAVALVALTGLLVVAPQPAEAHYSTYCGHFQSGTVNITQFYWHEGNMTHGAPGHLHFTYHEMLYGSDHFRTRECVY